MPYNLVVCHGVVQQRITWVPSCSNPDAPGCVIAEAPANTERQENHENGVAVITSSLLNHYRRQRQTLRLRR